MHERGQTEMTRWRKTKKRADNPCCLMAHGLSALRLCVWLELLEFEKIYKIPDILKDDGYPDVQAFIALI